MTGAVGSRGYTAKMGRHYMTLTIFITASVLWGAKGKHLHHHIHTQCNHNSQLAR